jgi:AraC family transcriptional activator FtrA
MPKTLSSLKRPVHHRIAILANAPLCLFDFSTVIEAFGYPDREQNQPWYDVVVVSADRLPLHAAAMAGVAATSDFGVLRTVQTIVIPGWRRTTEPIPPRLRDALRTGYARGARLAATCTGAFAIAAAGLLDGRRATTHWRHAAALASAYPKVSVDPDVLYIDEGRVLTSAGCAAGIDLCLHMIRCDYGPEAANVVARRMVVPPHRLGGQAQFVQKPLPASASASVAPLLDRLSGSLERPMRIDALARDMAMSRRTFLRRFEEATGTTPAKWMLAARLDRARSLFESTRFNIEQVATASGFGSAQALRHHFRAKYETTPTDYRKQFSRLRARGDSSSRPVRAHARARRTPGQNRSFTQRSTN